MYWNLTWTWPVSPVSGHRPLETTILFIEFSSFGKKFLQEIYYRRKGGKVNFEMSDKRDCSMRMPAGRRAGGMRGGERGAVLYCI